MTCFRLTITSLARFALGNEATLFGVRVKRVIRAHINSIEYRAVSNRRPHKMSRPLMFGKQCKDERAWTACTIDTPTSWYYILYPKTAILPLRP